MIDMLRLCVQTKIYRFDKKAASPHACGAAFDYAIAVPAGQIGGRYDLFI